MDHREAFGAFISLVVEAAAKKGFPPSQAKYESSLDCNYIYYKVDAQTFESIAVNWLIHLKNSSCLEEMTNWLDARRFKTPFYLLVFPEKGDPDIIGLF
jgi:hypothetical protein